MGDVRNILPSSWSSSSSLDAWIKQSPFLCLMRRNFCALKGASKLEKNSLRNPRFKPWMLWVGYFSCFSQRIAQIGSQASTRAFAFGDYTWRRNLESFGCNQIIVLIVHIVTGCPNEVTPFSLFNATQILCTYKFLHKKMVAKSALLLFLLSLLNEVLYNGFK